MDEEPERRAGAHRVDGSAHPTDSDTMSGIATTVSNLNSNANNVNGGVGTLLNYNPVISNIVTAVMPNESVRSNQVMLSAEC